MSSFGFEVDLPRIRSQLNAMSATGTPTACARAFSTRRLGCRLPASTSRQLVSDDGHPFGKLGPGFALARMPHG